MTRIFLRIYGGIVAALWLVILLSYGMLEGINYFRLSEYRLNVYQGPVLLLAESLGQCMSQAQPQCVEKHKKLMGTAFSLVNAASLKVSFNEMRRLNQGDLILRTDSSKQVNLFFKKIPVSGEQYVRLEVSGISEKLARATANLILQRLQHEEENAWPEIIAKLQKKFGYLIKLEEPNQILLDERQKLRIASKEPIVVINENAASVQIVASLPRGNKLLVLGPISPFNPFPLNVIVVIVLVGVSFLGLAAYLLVRPLEKRLRMLQRAAKSIKKGNLDARAEVDSADAVGQLSETFNDMAENIQRLLASQRELTSAVSHELRTPVARLRFGLEMIKDAEDKEELERYLKSLDKDIEELDELVDEILTYARLEEGTPVLNFKLIDVDLIIQQILKDLDAAASRARVKLIHIPENLPYKHRIVEGEERYVHRVIQNLAGNAIRYAQTQVHIRFIVDGTNCRVEIEDNGPGIPEDEWEHVFTPFKRLDNSRNRASGGYGLGLSIVQRIAYWHRGTVGVGKSRLGGAKFYMEWPRRQVSHDFDAESQGDVDDYDYVENLE